MSTKVQQYNAFTEQQKIILYFIQPVNGIKRYMYTNLCEEGLSLRGEGHRDTQRQVRMDTTRVTRDERLHIVKFEQNINIYMSVQYMYNDRSTVMHTDSLVDPTFYACGKESG